VNKEYEEQALRDRYFTVACFHATMLFPIYYSRLYRGVAMISRSWDGEVIARICEYWGYKTVRGSSSRGGKEALHELIEVVTRERIPSGLVVDAPRGPALKVKMGTVAIAKESGQLILPFVCWADRKLQFNSWDRMILPLPFGNLAMTWGKPTHVPQGLSHEDYERIRGEVEETMLEAAAQAVSAIENLKKR
jgi:lysophospholipid acyltransferase (LPLAT)-like uncharacterized protein